MSKQNPLNLNIDDFGSISIVPIRCGRNRGTAFFVHDNMLLTAKHIIGPYINNPIGTKIEVCLNDEWCQCSKAYDFEPADVVLLLCCKKNPMEAKLSIASSDCEKGEDLIVIGFPQEIGNGIDYFGVEVRNSRHLKKDGKDDLSRGFNVVVIRTDMLGFASYSGFSGSPVINSKKMVVGIATDQFFNSLGYTSISVLPHNEIFEQNGIPMHKEESDMSSFGMGTAIAKLDKQLEYAGARYSKHTHVENVNVNAALKAFCHIGKTKIEQEVKALMTQLFEKSPNKLKLHLEKKRDNGSYTALQQYIIDGVITDQMLYELEDVLYFKGEYSSGDIVLVNPLRKSVERLYTLVETVISNRNYEDASNLYVVGKAGQGKTHTLCSIADRYKEECSFYLFFGVEFDKERPIETILNIMDWKPGDLSVLNDKMVEKGHLAIFIIDALNEGSGTGYWLENLKLLTEELDKYDMIKLIVSYRTMEESDSLLSLLRNNWEKLEIEGFENTRNAIDTYFKANEIALKVEDVSCLPEFQSPLYLKIFCEACSMMCHSELVNWTRVEIYWLFLLKRNRTISCLVDEDPSINVTTQYVKRLAELSVENHLCIDVAREEALAIANELCKYRTWSNNLMNVMLQENILKEYTLRDGRRFIGFEYDSIGDYLKMDYIRTKSDELILEYVWQANAVLERHGIYSFEKTHVGNVIAALFSVWRPTIDTWKSLLETTKIRNIFVESLANRKDDAEYAQYISPLLDEVITWESGFMDPDKVLDNFKSYKYAIIDRLHNKLMSLPMVERDEVWTIKVNDLYSTRGILGRVDSLVESEKDNYDKLTILLCWLLTSSYQAVRYRIIKYLRDIFRSDLNLIIKTAEKFSNVNDAYVLQGLYGAAYAALVLDRNIGETQNVADFLKSTYYNEKSSAPSDLVVRNWTLKIIELAYQLDNEYKGWNDVLTLMPFISVSLSLDNNQRENEAKEPAFFGDTPGGRAISHSLFNWDFSRYIIGTNNYVYSPVFVKKDRLLKDISDLGRKFDVSLSNVEVAIAILIKEKYCYSKMLGEYDKKCKHGTRYEQDTERIGKKYQWLGYFEVLSYLCDNYKVVLNKYDSNCKFADNALPWLTEKVPYVDHTISYEESLSLESEKLFGLIEPDFRSIIDADKWLKDDHIVPSFHHILQDNEDNQWIVMKAFDTQCVLSDGKECTASVWYNGVLVLDTDIKDFEKWCKENHYAQSFYESGDYEYHWNDYPSASNFKDRVHCNDYKDDWGAPCSILKATNTQLQEDFTGCFSQIEHLREAISPCVDIMEILELHNAERGIIRDNEGKLAAININSTSSRMSGLVIKRSLLDDYLNKAQCSLYYFMDINKQVSGPAVIIGESKFNQLLKYDTNKGVIDVVKMTKE